MSRPPMNFCRRFALVTLIALALGATGLRAAAADAPRLSLWQGQRALDDIAKQISFGDRAVGMPGHKLTRAYIEAQLRQEGIEPKEQHWISDAGGHERPLTNIIGRFDPADSKRIIIGTHYDSIIRAYRDKKHPNAVMPGADNSASGVAVLLETLRVLTEAKTKPPFGVDFVFFDGEEGPISLGEGDPLWRPLGSAYFADHLGDFYPKAKPEQAAIFDMVCYRAERLQPEQGSMLYAPDQVAKFWQIGHALGPRFFELQPTDFPIFDDHTPLNAAGIPSFLVIGWNYKPWYNTTQDTLDKCSEAAMNAVGRSLIRYIYAP